MDNKLKEFLICCTRKFLDQKVIVKDLLYFFDKWDPNQDFYKTINKEALYEFKKSKKNKKVC